MQVESHAVATTTILVVFLPLSVGRKAGQQQRGWKWRREMVKGCVGAAAGTGVGWECSSRQRMSCLVTGHITEAHGYFLM